MLSGPYTLLQCQQKQYRASPLLDSLERLIRPTVTGKHHSRKRASSPQFSLHHGVDTNTYRRPMGLNTSGDEYCYHGDITLDGLSNTVKVVDDILMFENSFPKHVQRVQQFLRCCRMHGITLNPEKFQIAQAQVKFCGCCCCTEWYCFRS